MLFLSDTRRIGVLMITVLLVDDNGLCWLLGSSARVYAVKEDYHAVLPS